MIRVYWTNDFEVDSIVSLETGNGSIIIKQVCPKPSFVNTYYRVPPLLVYAYCNSAYLAIAPEENAVLWTMDYSLEGAA